MMTSTRPARAIARGSQIRVAARITRPGEWREELIPGTLPSPGRTTDHTREGKRQMSETFTRRSLLGAAAGGAAAVAFGGVPAWARAAGVRRPDSRPFPHLPAGTATLPEIEHVVVLMMENHSFDNVLGMVPHRVPGRRRADGLTVRHGAPVNFNPDAQGGRGYA